MQAMRAVALLLVLTAAPAYRYFITGRAEDIQTHPTPAFALIGGGQDVDEINSWFVGKAAGGDLLVLRASGTDAYNSYFYKLTPLNSVQTLVIPSREAAQDKFVANKIRRAEAIFIAGGDQWNYVHLWNESPVGDALRAAIVRGIPLGGTSAGLAILGEYIFTAENDTVTSQEALLDPYAERVKIASGFLRIPALKNTITDSHFKARDRMGRTLVFLARILQDFHLQEARAIAIDERTAALMEPDGKLRVAGLGHVYFLRARTLPSICRPEAPLTMAGVEVYRAGAGSRFDLAKWTGAEGNSYLLSVTAGVIHSNLPGGAIY
jgi:cyanophycinase